MIPFDLVDSCSSMSEVFEKVCNMESDATAQMYKKDIYDRSMCPYDSEENGRYVGLNYKRLMNVVENISCGIMDISDVESPHIGILSQSRVEWTWCDLSILGLNGVVVPVYKSLTLDNQVRIINDSDMDGIVVENLDIADSICESDNVDLDFVITMDDCEPSKERVYTLKDVYDYGVEMEYSTCFDDSNDSNDSDDSENRDRLASIVYTSGTTGKMKGVRLTHGNILGELIQINSLFRYMDIDMYPEQRNLSFLPLAHIYERLTGQYHALSRAGTIAYAESTDTLVEDIQSVNPNIMYSVPRLYIRLDEKMSESVPDPILRLGKKTARQWVENDERGIKLRLKHKLMDKLFYSKVRSKFGDDMDVMVSGGGKIPEKLLKEFKGMSIPICQGYGLTETAGAISVTTVSEKNMGCVGKPSTDTDIRVDSDDLDDRIVEELDGEVGELLVKGPHVTDGYYKNDIANKESFTSDGYFRTGDIFQILGDERLVYYDRKKLLIVLDTGKNVAPAPIEQRFNTCSMIDNIMIVGDNRPFISALIVPSREYFSSEFDEVDIDSDLSQYDVVRDSIQVRMDEYNDEVEGYKKIRDFQILDTEWSVENKYLTPTMKLNRRRISEDFADKISSIYES